MTCQPYIIVVEVDNKRALAAYQGGIDALEILWPQIKLITEQEDAKYRKLAEDDIAEKKAKILEEDKQVYAYKAYIKAKDEWEAKPFYLKGPVPEVVKRPSVWGEEIPGLERYSGYLYGWSPNRADYVTSYYTSLVGAMPARDSFMAALKRDRDIASAANAPYRMTESDALNMIAWENGEALERAKKLFLEPMADQTKGYSGATVFGVPNTRLL